MKSFGVYSPGLKQKAKESDFPEPIYSILKHSSETVSLQDGVLITVEGPEDRSAYGLPDASGVVVLSVEENGILFFSGIQKGDVLRAVNDENVSHISELLKLTSKNRWEGSMDFTIIRDQKEQVINITIK